MLVRVKLICTFPGKVIFIRLDCVGHNVLVLNPWLLNKQVDCFLQETRNILCWWRRNNILECVIFSPLHLKEDCIASICTIENLLTLRKTRNLCCESWNLVLRSSSIESLLKSPLDKLDSRYLVQKHSKCCCTHCYF